MKELKIKADIENLTAVNDFLHDQIDEENCSAGAVMQLEIAVEELFSNICYYAYGDGDGDVCIRSETDGGGISVTFADQGAAYDPLSSKAPDIGADIENRPVGGLGIFMVKEMVDDICYEYRDGENILTFRKNLK